MNDRHDKKEQSEGNYFGLCQRLAELEGEAGQPQIIEEKLPEGAQPCTLAEAINDGLAMIDENMRINFANNRFCEIIGYSRGEVVGRLASDFLPEADKKIFEEQISRRKTGKGDQYELTLLRKDGEKAFVVISPRPIFAPDGSFKGSIAVITDITDRIRAEEKLLSTTQELEVRVQKRTADLKSLNKGLEREISERKRTEEELLESREIYRSLVENIDLGINLIDANHTILMVNAATARFFNKPASYFIGKKCFRKFEQRAAVCSHCPGTQAMATGKPAEVETEGVLENGSRIPVRIRAFPSLGPDGTSTGFIEVVEDISENKQAEEEKKKLEGQFLQTKKLEAISTLSGGVAQELSNLFQAVHGYVERLMWGKEQDDPRYQELLEITNAAFRGAVLSKRLLAFSGIIESKKQSIDLNQEIKKVHKLLMRTMPETIELELHLANEITIINGDPNQIEQALLALAVNARDAMPGGGKIIIETKRMILGDDFRRTHAGAAMGECALITVSDTGPGLGQKTLEHVFDPFYSKEDSSEKTGLGLSMVYGIVKNHGGYISCSSEPKVGTTFMIYLPITEKEAEID